MAINEKFEYGALTVLGDAVVEFAQGGEILPRVFEAVYEAEVGFAGFLVQNIAVVLDLDPPNVKVCNDWSMQRIRL